MSRRNQQPELDCWLAPVAAADGGDENEERDEEEYDIPDSSLSIATTSKTSRFPAVLVAAGVGNSCGHNSAFSLLRNRVAAQVQESVSRVKSRLGCVMRRRPRYCSAACSKRLLLNYRHLPSTASLTSRRTQSADDSTTFSQRSGVYNDDYFGGDGSRSSRTVATASVSIDLSTKPPQYKQQQLSHNLQNTSYTCTSSGYLPKSNIQNIQPPMPRSTLGSAWGDVIEPRVASGAGKTTHGHRRVYAPEFCLLANRSYGSSDVNKSPGAVHRRIYLPPDALRGMAQLGVGQKPQPLSHQKMRHIDTSEVIEVTVYAETSEEEVSWPVPLAMNSSSAQDSSQQPLDDAPISQPAGGTNDGGGGGDGSGGGGGGGCCGRGSKAKARQSAIHQDPLPELSEPVTMQGQPLSSDAKKLESDTVESEGDIMTMSIVVDTNLATSSQPDENTREEEEEESSISTPNDDWVIEVGEGSRRTEMAASTSTMANLRRNSQQLPPLPEEATGEGAAMANTMTPIPMETTTEEEDSAPPARVPSKRPSNTCGCTVETLPHPRASMESHKISLALSETHQSDESFPALPQQAPILPTPRQEAGPQSDQHPAPQLDQPSLTQSHQISVRKSNQPCVPQFHKRFVPPPCRSSDLIATSHLPSEILELNCSPRRSSDFEKCQQICRLNSEVIQPQNAFRQSSPFRAHRKPSKLLMPPQVSCKLSQQRMQSTPKRCKPSVLVAPPEVHAAVNQTKTLESKSTKSQASCDTSWKAPLTGGIDYNSSSSSFMTQELEISLTIDGDTRKECMQAIGTSQCTISSSLVLDTETSDSASAVYDLHVGTDGQSTMKESDSDTVIEELGGDNRSLSTTDSDSLNERSVNERIYQTSQLSTGSDILIEEVHVGCNRQTGKSLSQALDMANVKSSVKYQVSRHSTESDDISIEEVHVGCNRLTGKSLSQAFDMAKSSVKYQVSRHSTEESDDISIEEVHVGCNRLTGKSLSQAFDMTNLSKSGVKYQVSRHSTEESDDMSIEEVHVGYNRATSLNEGLNKINHSVMSSRNNKARSSSTNTCTSERADQIPPADITMIENSSVDATSLNWNATNSYVVATECLTIRPAVYTRTDAVLTEVDLPVARQTCSLCQVASLPTVNHTNDQGSSFNDPATTSRPTDSTDSKRNKLSKHNRSCNTNEHDTHDTDGSSVVFQFASRVEDESSNGNVLSAFRDRPMVEFFADDDADWVWQQRQICLIQTPPLVLQARTVPCGPAREERRVSHQPMRIHQYLMPTKVGPVEYAAFKGTVSWLADCHLLNFVQPKGDVLLSVAGYRPVFSKVHHVPDRSLKLATTAPLQLLRNDTGGLMTSATVAAAVRGVAACECSTGSVAPMLSTKFSTVEVPGVTGTASMRRRLNYFNASNNAEGRGALSKRLLTSWLRQKTAAAAATGCQKTPSTISPPLISPPPLFSPPQFAQIVYSSGESRWLCLTKPRDYEQQEEQQQQCPVELGTRETNSRSESLSIINNWEASTGDTNNNNRDDFAMTSKRWRPPLPPTLHHSTTFLIQDTVGRLDAAAVASAVAVQAAAMSTVEESEEVSIVTAVANAAATICDIHSSRGTHRHRVHQSQLARPEQLRSSRTVCRSTGSHLLSDKDPTVASFLWWSLVPLTSSDS